MPSETTVPPHTRLSRCGEGPSFISEIMRRNLGEAARDVNDVVRA